MATILGDFAEDLVVVGGLVPSLIIDQNHLPTATDPHVGTLDLDVGLALTILDDAWAVDAVAVFRRDFLDPDQLGPHRVLAFPGRQGDDDLAADVSGFVRAFLDAL